MPQLGYTTGPPPSSSRVSITLVLKRTMPKSYSKEVAQSAGYANRKLPIVEAQPIEEHSVNKAYNTLFAISLSETQGFT